MPLRAGDAQGRRGLVHRAGSAPGHRKEAVALSPNKKRSSLLELLRFLLYNVTTMKQYQQTNYTKQETGMQVVLPLDVETIIPEDESVRTFMRMKDDHMQNGQLKPGYKVQLGIEAEYIVGVDVSSDLNDTRALLPLVKRMEEKGGVKHQDVTTDSGYETEETYRGLAEREQTAYIKPQNYDRNQRRSFRQNAYLWENMPYDKEKNCFTCPAGQELRYIGNHKRKTKNGFEQTVSTYQTEGCTSCPYKAHCTKAKENRTIQVNWAFEAARAASRERSTASRASCCELTGRSNRKEPSGC